MNGGPGVRLSALQREILLFCHHEKFVTCGDLLKLWRLEAQERGYIFGKAQYGSAHASLSRSIKRLWGKNLVIIWKSITKSPYSRTAITLTDAGYSVAESLLGDG
jgi:hypothetical protein